MPKVKKQSSAAGPALLDSPLDPSQIIEGQAVPIQFDWLPQVLDSKRDFFDALRGLPDGAWEHVLIYLYRLDPAVANRAGEKKYIAVYSTPISEDSIKREHGGGKFWAMLKLGEDTLRNHRFWIEGEPIFKDGQTMRGGQTPGGPVVPGQQDIGSIVRQVIEATGGNSKAADAGIEVMKRAMMDGMELNKTIVTSQMNSTTGSTLGDKLFDSLLPRLLAPPVAPQTDPIILKLVEATISNMKADRREPNPAPPAPATDQLSLVKELLGVESLREVIDMGRGGREQPWWVTVLGNAIEKLPTLLQEYASMQERGFQRAIIAHQLGAGQMPPPQPPNMVRTDPARVVPIPPTPPTPAPPATTGNMSEQMVQAIVEGICRAFDEGYPGDVAAAHIKLLYPQLVQSLAPLLGNPAQLNSFIANMPPLAQRATDEEWPGFQQEFIEEIAQQNAPPPADVPRETLSMVEAPAKPPASTKAPAPPKKKANGTAH
jgi:hypothetical protein